MFNLAKLDHLALAIAASEILSVGLLREDHLSTPQENILLFLSFSNHVSKIKISWGCTTAAYSYPAV